MLCHLLDRGDVVEFEARYRNDNGRASAYHPRVLVRIILLAYSLGITSSRAIEALCRRDTQFMAVSGDLHPQFTTIAGLFTDGVSGAKAAVPQRLALQERWVPGDEVQGYEARLR